MKNNAKENVTKKAPATKETNVTEFTSLITNYNVILKGSKVIKVKANNSVVLICAVRKNTCTFYAHANVIEKLTVNTTITTLKDCVTFSLDFNESKKLLKQVNTTTFAKESKTAKKEETKKTEKTAKKAPKKEANKKLGHAKKPANKKVA